METPPKSALKSKRRQSILLAATPPPVRHASVSQSPNTFQDQDDNIIYRQRKEIRSVVEEEPIPEHHRVLYELLGTEKADSILNPKIEEPVKTEQVETEQEVKRKLPTVDTCLGAGALWRILKKESEKKLFKMDKRIPLDWKMSYGAYMRNNINKNQSMVERSFTHHADIPELGKLLDQRYKERVHKARHHMNVMFRSSQNNKNRTTLLLGNNPVPDYNDREGNESLSRYFPVHLSSSKPPSSGQHMQLVSSSVPEVKPIPIRRFSNLRFLTENKAQTRGKFYGRYTNLEMKMVTDIPGFKVDLPPSMKERVVVSAPVHDLTSIRRPSSHRRLFTPRSPDKRDPTWQPLTFGSLMEYAATKYALGNGEFQHGQSSRWKISTPATA